MACGTLQPSFEHLTTKRHVRRVWDRLDEAVAKLGLPKRTCVDEVYSDARS